ncbi:MAG: RecQ family ATP-dependent DNA helicase [Rhodospirillaceae bacterium]|nr:RecQ family ATP-dependent DNA helicase [Rhodospirillaceae bacterium]
MASYAESLALLRKALDDETTEFRDGQFEAIDALANRRERLLVVQRTGWGKSFVYFIATRLLRDRGRGPTLIVSPLLALMRNQIQAAERLHLRARTINSTNREEWAEIDRALQEDRVDILLISPERLANEDFLENTLMPMAGRIGLLAVDEAHCISDWGHDFRPDYRRLVNFLRLMPDNVPILGTTATANDRVIADVRAQLGDIGIQRGSLRRRSLELQNIRMPSQAERLAWLDEHVGALPGTGIIYTLTKRDAYRVSGWLARNGVAAEAYHSDVADDRRRRLEDRLLENRIKALVATTALGMGYDKPDLGFVVHFQAPGSIIGYYQQVGVVLSGEEDGRIHEFFRRTAFPDEGWVTSILDALEDSDGLSIRELETAINLRYGQIEKALKFLSVESPAPAVKVGSKWRRTPVPYSMDRERIRRLTGQRETEWDEVQRYIDHRGCLMAYLARALDDPAPGPCGKCASCLGRPVISPSYDRATAPTAARFLARSEQPLRCKTQAPKDAFAEYDLAGSLPADWRAETGRVLSRWGDPPWGRAVAEDKQKGRFRDELVDAAAEMLRERWRPAPWPAWVACVPSRKRPRLVSDYAARLARALDLPFEEAVVKLRDNEEQKMQHNRHHQCRNLDGVFAIESPIRPGPVLLVDDVADSGWTLTVISVLLRRAGSGPVWPLALASASMAG